MSDLIERLPAGPVEKPVEQWTDLELLHDNTRTGLMRTRELLSLIIPIDPVEPDPGQMKLLGIQSAAALKTATIYADIQRTAFEAGQGTDKAYKDMLKIIREIQEKGKPKQ